MLHNSLHYFKSKPCWILCTPRTGSTYLSNLLNNLNVFPSYESLCPSMVEALIDSLGAESKNKTFGEWLRFYTSEQLLKSPPFFCKSISHHFLDIISDDFKFDIVLPRFKFVVLKRLNLLEQASSIYIAEHLKQWHLRNEGDFQKYIDRKVEINESEIIRFYEEVISISNFWDKYVNDSSYLEVYYEDLQSNPHESIKKIMDFLEIDVCSSSIKNSVLSTNLELVPTNHPSKKEVISFLEGYVRCRKNF